MSDQANIDALKARVPGLAVVTEGDEVAEKSHDWWIRGRMTRRLGEKPFAAAVARPENTKQVAGILAWADETRTAVVPYGLGSGVCGAIEASRDQIVIDMGAMDRIVDLSEENLTVTVQPGMRGCDFEEALAKRGFTMGHFPQSIDLSSVGGWCSTRASGQLSTRYGNIEDMLLGCEVVLPGGRVATLANRTRAAAGPDLKHLFMGAEGTLGVFTELTLRIHRTAEAQRGMAFSLPDLAAGCESLRRILASGWTPAVTRLYDAMEAGRNFDIESEERPVLLLLSEGPAAYVDAELGACRAVLAELGATEHGEGPVDSWMGRRNHVPDIDELIEGGLSIDTIEVAIGWDKLHELFETVPREGMKIDGMAAFSGHVSHCYTQGANIYFTFAATAEGAAGVTAYDAAWEHTMRMTHELGGTIAHHHGIGRVRKAWLPKELGTSFDVLVAVKRAIDPNNIMNPGALLDV